MSTPTRLVAVLSALLLPIVGCQDAPQPTELDPAAPELARAGNPGNGTVRVTPRTLIDVQDAAANGTAGWFFREEGAATKASGALVRGPEKPPRSVGSAEFVLDDASGGMSLGTVEYRGTRLDEFSRLHYCTYRTATGPDAVAPALQFSADYDLEDADNSFQGRLVFEPHLADGAPDAAPVQIGEWQCWDALDGYWWATGAPGNTVAPQSNPQTIQTILANFPDAGVRNPDGHFFGALILKAGSGWAGGFEGNADKLVVGVDGEENVYDFDRPRPRGTGR